MCPLHARHYQDHVRSKVCLPKTNTFLKPTLCTTCIQLEAPNVCMWYDSVGFRKVLVLGRRIIYRVQQVLKFPLSQGIRTLSSTMFLTLWDLVMMLPGNRCDLSRVILNYDDQNSNNLVYYSYWYCNISQLLGCIPQDQVSSDHNSPLFLDFP